jgi:multidrug efflux system membrane fusion protein
VKLNIAYCHITAPISGRLGLRLVDPGNYVTAAASTPLAVITQEDPMSVIFTLPEDQLGEVIRRFNAGSHLSVEAYDREMNRKIATGYLTTIDNQIDQTTGTVKMRATFSNPAGRLFPNQFVNAKMLVEQRRNVVLVQNAAVQRNPSFVYAFLVKPDSTVTIRHLTLGATDGENTEILSGLNAGDTVVMTGVDKLQEGTKVKVHMDGEQPRQASDNGSGGRETGMRGGDAGANQ